MRRIMVLSLIISISMALAAQNSVLVPPSDTTTGTESSAQAALPAQPAALPAAPSAASVSNKADALLLYKQGRDLDALGKTADAAIKYQQSIVVCDREIARDTTRMDAYTVKCWSLFRLDRFKQVVDVGALALKIKFDARIVETMGESFYHLGEDANALKYLQRYIDNVGEFGDRVPSAYFYMAESYLRQKRYDHADIAYSFAVYREGNIPRWWFRYASVAELLGEYKRAYDLYAKALKLSPGLKEASDGMARVKARI